jgi:hypothetical protein
MNLTHADLVIANIARDEVSAAFPEWNISALSEELQHVILAIGSVAAALGRQDMPDPFIGHEPSESEFWGKVYEMQDYRDRTAA